MSKKLDLLVFYKMIKKMSRKFQGCKSAAWFLASAGFVLLNHGLVPSLVPQHGY